MTEEVGMHDRWAVIGCMEGAKWVVSGQLLHVVASQACPSSISLSGCMSQSGPLPIHMHKYERR
jgi:hypothetical protein